MAVTLPPGWAITASVETVPDPNAATEPIAAGPGFARWTYICTDQNGQYVCGSGAEEDCEAQALTAAQSRTQQQPYDEAI
jgi:hypothetical protein